MTSITDPTPYDAQAARSVLKRLEDKLNGLCDRVRNLELTLELRVAAACGFVELLSHLLDKLFG